MEKKKMMYDIINLAIEAADEMLELINENSLTQFMEDATSLLEMLGNSLGLADELDCEEKAYRIREGLESVMDSLMRLSMCSLLDRERAARKVEFELIPLLQEIRLNFYFWAYASSTKEGITDFKNRVIHELGGNKYTDQAESKGEYKYDISIFVLAYNKVEMTKNCITWLLSNIPENITYELILMNNGSTDETKSYFESINPDKQIDIKHNGVGYGIVSRIYEGKYLLAISNDVLVQKNSIKNLYSCMESDEMISVAVPATSNVSNLQSLSEAIYDSEEGLKNFSEKNNTDDEVRYEQRCRLVDPIAIIRAKHQHELKWGAQNRSRNRLSFPDDRMSAIIRRAGYKMVWVENAYCHHYGSMTLRSDGGTYSAEAFNRGRIAFYNDFGIDPWKKVWYSPSLIKNMKIEAQEGARILEISGGVGANGLKIKEELRKKGKRNVTLFCIESNEKYIEDCRAIADKIVIGNDLGKIEIEERYFDFLLYEELIEDVEMLQKIYSYLLQKGKQKSIIVLKTTEKNVETIKKNMGERVLLVQDFEDQNYWIITKG